MIITYITNDGQAEKALVEAYAYAMTRQDEARFVTCIEDSAPTDDWHNRQLFDMVNDIMKVGDELVVYDASSLGLVEEELQELFVHLALKGIVLHVLKYKMKMRVRTWDAMYAMMEAA